MEDKTFQIEDMRKVTFRENSTSQEPQIPDERIAHMHGVAEYMYAHAADYNLQDKKDELYIIGLIHDVGAVINVNRHEEIGAKLLADMGLSERYADIIHWHGKNPEDYCRAHNIDETKIPKELLLLWEADLHIGPSGEYMAFDDRLEDMRKRHKQIAEEFDVHVGVTVDGDGYVSNIQYHKTYGLIAENVIKLLRKKNIVYSICKAIKMALPPKNDN